MNVFPIACSTEEQKHLKLNDFSKKIQKRYKGNITLSKYTKFQQNPITSIKKVASQLTDRCRSSESSSVMCTW